MRMLGRCLSSGLPHDGDPHSAKDACYHNDPGDSENPQLPEGGLYLATTGKEADEALGVKDREAGHNQCERREHPVGEIMYGAHETPSGEGVCSGLTNRA